MSSIDLIICDDHPIFRIGLKSMFSGQQKFKIVAEAENGLECLVQIKNYSPDIVLLDIKMPKMDGIQCLKQIKQLNANIKVIILTQFDDKYFVRQLMKYGADGYVLKSATKPVLLKAINEVLMGKCYLSPDAKANTLNFGTKERGDKLFPEFSERQLEIIKLICNEKSSKQIAETLNLSFHTIESHRALILKKLGVDNIAGLVKWAVYRGLD